MNLALISGIAGILGLILQINDAFPEHRQVRQAVVLVIFGFFAGAIASALTQAQVHVIGGVPASYALIAALVVIGCVLVAVAAFTSDEQRRGELYTASAVTGGAMFTIFFLVAAAWALSGPRQGNLTLDEYLVLSTESQRRGNFERAIEHAEDAGVFLDDSDPRQQALKVRVERLKAAQAAAAGANSTAH